MKKSRYTLVCHPSVDREELAGLLDQIEPEILASEDEGELLPRKTHTGPCRICGRVAELTREHIPPRSALNRDSVVFSEGDALFDEGLLTQPKSGRQIQGGLSAYVLCDSCNNFTGTKYVREYQEWVLRGAGGISDIHDQQLSLDQINASADQFPIDAVFRDVYPGRFVRQVISMMMSVSGGPELGQRFPDLRNLALGGIPRELPEPLRIYLDLFAGPGGRIAGGRSGHFVGTAGVLRQVLEICYPPFALILLIGGTPDPNLGCDISFFTDIDLEHKTEVEFSDLRIGFNNSNAPTDSRTLGQIEGNREYRSEVTKNS